MALGCSRGALLLLCLAACLSYVGAGIIPGTKGAPVHLGGGFKIENMDAFAMTVGAMVLSVIRSAPAPGRTARGRAPSRDPAAGVRARLRVRASCRPRGARALP